MSEQSRPLSPHLQIYRPELTSILSILHRMTGMFLSLGVVMLAFWLVTAAAGEAYYAWAEWFLSSWLGYALLAAWSFCLFYHLCNGIRHLCWDLGLGFELRTIYASGRDSWFSGSATRSSTPQINWRFRSSPSATITRTSADIPTTW